jgi:type II secretory pathway pseudopilin PulG
VSGRARASWFGRPAAGGAFTLIEILVSLSIAMILLTVVTSAMYTTRRLIQRGQARLEMHQRSGLLFMQLQARIGMMQQHGALVAFSNNDQVGMLWLRGKEDYNDWDTSWFKWNEDTTDMLWELWVWNKSDGVLRVATSSFNRTFNPVPNSLHLNGVDYSAMHFQNMPQPRRVLNHTDWAGTLDQNQLFPNLGATTAASAITGATPSLQSLASPKDLGDWGELQQKLLPTLNNVTDFGISMVQHNGTTQNFTIGSNQLLVLDGIRTDALVARDVNGDGVINTSDAAASAIGARPVLVRFRWSMNDPVSGLTTPFTFSIQAPSL